MSTLHEVPPTSVDDPVVVPDVEALFAEARARGRRRRLRNLVIVVILLAALGAAAGLVFRAQDPARTSAHHHAPRPLPVSTAFPSTFVGYDVDDKTNVGGIKLFSSTGKALRTIAPVVSLQGPTNFSNLGSGFQLSDDGSTVYYAETTSESSPLRIVSSRVSGGPTTDLGVGSEPAVSADNTFLAYRPGDPHADAPVFPSSPTIAVVDLRTKTTRTVTVPGMAAGQRVQYSWLPGVPKLLVATTDVEGPPPMVPAGGARIVKDPGLVSRAQIYDVTTGRFTALPSATVSSLEQTASSDVTVTGPAGAADTVRVTGTLKSAGSSVAHEAVGTLDVRTGGLVWQHVVPSGYYLAWPAALAGQSLGRHFLLEGPNGLQAFAWTPTSGSAPTPIEATLNTTGISPSS